MNKIISSVLVFLLLMNGTVTIMEGSGMTEDLGVDLAPGISDEMNDLIDNMKAGFSANAGPGDTLFSLFAAGLSFGSILISSVYATPSAMLNMGFPAWIVFPIFAPMYLLSGLYLLYLATGRQSI